jgi:hypothetical protein
VATLYLPPLYPYQRRLLEDTHRDICTVSATQIGKTFAEACWLMARAWEDPVRLHPWWWTAPTYNQAMTGFKLMLALCSSAGIIQGAPRESMPQQIKLINGAVIEFRSRDNFEGLMGSTIAGAVVDEAGSMTVEQHAAISTRRSATLGPIHFIGNPGMVAGPFRRLCALGESGEDGVHSLHRWTWKDRHAALPPEQAAAYAEFIEQERQTQADFEFRRLYEAEWTEDEAAVFRGVDLISDGAPLETGAPGERYAIGIDVGQQVDYLAAIGIGMQSRRADFMLRFRGIPYPQAAQRVVEITKRFPGWCIVESNGPGLGFYQELRRLNVACSLFDTTTRSKDELVMGLAGALNPEAPKLRLAVLPPLQHELKIFRYTRRASGFTYSYSAPAGEHDDTVMALALAHLATRRAGSAAWLVA